MVLKPEPLIEPVESLLGKEIRQDEAVDAAVVGTRHPVPLQNGTLPRLPGGTDTDTVPTITTRTAIVLLSASGKLFPARKPHVDLPNSIESSCFAAATRASTNASPNISPPTNYPSATTFSRAANSQPRLFWTPSPACSPARWATKIPHSTNPSARQRHSRLQHRKSRITNHES